MTPDISYAVRTLLEARRSGHHVFLGADDLLRILAGRHREAHPENRQS